MVSVWYQKKVAIIMVDASKLVQVEPCYSSSGWWSFLWYSKSFFIVLQYSRVLHSQVELADPLDVGE